MENRTAQYPTYRRIADRLALELDAGSLRHGDRVISVRRLARREGVSIPTAVAALRRLESQGLIVARPRSGWRMAPRSVDVAAAGPVRATPTDVSVRGLATEMIALRQQTSIPLGAGVPQGDWMARDELDRAIRVATKRLGFAAHSYSFAPGEAELRLRLARHLGTKGITVAPDDLVVTAGVTEAVELALKATTKPGDVVAVESPCYFGHLMTLERLGLRAVEIRTDPMTGIDVDGLSASIDSHGIKAVIASPSLHNPTGASMPLAERQRLVAELSARDVVLIEDDIYGDLAPDAISPCKAFDARRRVIYCGSSSKTVAPGWRLGWIIGAHWHDEIFSQRIERSLAGSRLYEVALAQFLSGGRYERHLARFKERLANSRQAFVARVAASFPAGTRIAGAAWGCLLWVEMPPSVDAVAMMREAALMGIGVAPGPVFSATLSYRNYIRLNLVNDPTPRLLGAVDRLGRIACRMTRV